MKNNLYLKFKKTDLVRAQLCVPKQYCSIS